MQPENVDTQIFHTKRKTILYKTKKWPKWKTVFADFVPAITLCFHSNYILSVLNHEPGLVYHSGP